jgi:hypothetical protein
MYVSGGFIADNALRTGVPFLKVWKGGTTIDVYLFVPHCYTLPITFWLLSFGECRCKAARAITGSKTRKYTFYVITPSS